MDMQLKTNNRHKKIVEELQKQVTSGISQKRQSTSSHTMRTYLQNPHGLRLDLGALDQILHVDVEKRVALVEPKVTMEKLAKGLLPYGIIPPVIAEFKNITVGGAINGAALESTSHAHGQFNDVCLAYNVLLSDGSVVRASRSENSDLFYGISGSYGSIGQIVSVEIGLVPIKPWVKVNYTRHNFTKNTIEQLANATRKSEAPQFLEGLIFDKGHGIAVEGVLTDDFEAGSYILKQKNHWEPWYYQILRERSSRMSDGDSGSFFMPIEDYLFRYDRGAFWMGSYFLHGRLLMNFLTGRWKNGNFNELRDPGNLFRGLWGWICNSKRLYSILHWNGENFFSKRAIIQDFYIPENRTLEFAEKAFDITGISPLWICPVKTCGREQIFAPHAVEDDLVFDVGVYGFPKENGNGQTLTSQLEKLAHSFGGRKMLYSYTFFSEEEFWKVYSKENYEKLRKKWDRGNTWTCILKKVLRTN